MSRHKTKTKDQTETQIDLSLEEAMENLSTIAQMEVDEKTTLGLLKGEKIVVEGGEYSYTDVIWLFPEDHLNFIASVRPSFAALVLHLEKLFQKHQADPDNVQIQKGMESIFTLSIDAVEKVKEYFALFGKNVDLSQTEEFKKLEELWKNKIKPALGTEAETWGKDWAKNADSKTLDFDFTGLKDWETIKADRAWELLHLKDENEKPLFDSSLLRDIKISAVLSSARKSKEDFILFLAERKAADLQLSSKHILMMVGKEVAGFYKSHFDFSKNKLAALFSKAVFALFLAANPKNLNKNTKNSLGYFRDFQLFLRQALKALEYRQAAFSRKKNQLFSSVNELCYQFFTKVVTIKEEMIGYLHRLGRMNAKKQAFKNLNLQKKIELFDENVRSFLDQMPSGPVIKLLQAIQKEQKGFDPILESSTPSKLYEFEIKNKKCTLLHLPSPTVQEKISMANLSDEFIGFLEALKEKGEKLLFINLQDRNSYKEAARVKILETLAQKEEFGKALAFVSLNKDSSFYHQSEGYAHLEKAEDFLNVFLEKLVKGNDDFLILPMPLTDHMQTDLQALLNKIHQLFFLEKAVLSHEERVDFIELFYHFFVLKLIEDKKPDFLAFSSKDGVDSAAAFNASFLIFLKQLAKSKFKPADEDFILFLLYAPALLVRHRAIDRVVLNRTLACLDHLEERHKEVRKVFVDLFSKVFLNSIQKI